MIPLRRAAWYAAAPLVGLLLYWRVPFTWFQNDDFAWLGLPMEARAGGLKHALFAPFAQGTVRVLSERAFFLTFSEIFGLHALPYRMVVLATWILALTLVLLIGERLTGSRTAGLVAALLWAVNTNAVPAVAWASAYNEILCGACLLGAFYSRLRGWRVAEWTAYLAGFGALELMVVYPFLAALHAWCTDRKTMRSALWLFVPAVAFTAMHFIFIPRPSSPVYALALDGRLPGSFGKYLAWTLEPGSSALGARAAAVASVELAAGLALGLALAFFVVRCILARQWMAVFFCGWFVLLLAPVLPLANHVTSYYLTLPSIGLAWLGGWAVASAWKDGGAVRLGALALAGLYFAGSAAGINAQTRWFKLRGERMRMVMEGVAATVTAHPGVGIALEGVDAELQAAGFEDHPFRLVGAAQVWVNETPPGQVRVLEVTGDGVRDVTGN